MYFFVLFCEVYFWHFFDDIFCVRFLYLDLNDEANEEETCENCNLTRPKTQILIHIGQTKACKTHYGPRFKAMKAQNERERKQKSRASKKARKQAEENKCDSDDNLDDEEEPTLSCEQCRRELENLDKEVESTLSCEHCNEEFRSTLLLKHIAFKSDCKAFYGPKFQEMKKKNLSVIAYLLFENRWEKDEGT